MSQSYETRLPGGICPVNNDASREVHGWTRYLISLACRIYYVRPWEGFIEPEGKTLITAYFLSLNTKLIDKI